MGKRRPVKIKGGRPCHYCADLGLIVHIFASGKRYCQCGAMVTPEQKRRHRSGIFYARRKQAAERPVSTFAEYVGEADIPDDGLQ